MENKEVNLIITKLRRMYEEAFPDDSKKYIDYFFEKKLKKSGGGFVYKQYDNILPSMLVLAKKEIVYYTEEDNEQYENIRSIFCIDAVTTKKEHRGKGYMNRLFEEVLFKQFKNSQTPFLILYTHIPEFYEKFGFEKAFTYYEFNKEVIVNNDIELVKTKDFLTINRLYNNTISADIKLYRNYANLANRIDELSNEDGSAYLIKYKGKTKGYCFISGNGKELDEIVYSGDYKELEGSIISKFDDIPLYNKENKETEINGLMMKILNPIEFFKMLKFNLDDTKIKFKLKRKLLDDLNLEIEIKNNKVLKVEILQEEIFNSIDEVNIIRALRGIKQNNEFLDSIEKLDIFFAERF